MIVGNPLSSISTSPVQQAFLATGDALTALAERTAYVDRVVIETAGDSLFPAAPSGLTVLAVGGYGRRQLFPYSDVDLLLLFESERLAVASKEALSAFLQRLWDSGLRVSHSVRTPSECTEVHDTNTELNVSLLDQRYLAGDRALYARLIEKLPRFILGNRDALIRNLSQLTRERHGKFANTFYHLEPNVKEGPGGLRDYQLICWLAQMRDTDAHRMGVADPAVEIQQAFRFLARLRCYLHCQSGRDNNLLSFESQDASAEHWEDGGAIGDPAEWMREYYRHARAVYRAAIRQLEASEAQSSSLFAQFRDWRSRLANADFSVHRERAHFRAPQGLDAGTDLILRFFEFIGRHGIRASFEAEQQIETRRARLRARFAESQLIWPSLNTIFSLPYAPLAVRSMHETGLLTAVFPELEGIECLVVRDFYHRYTVDEHTQVAFQNLWELRSADEQPLSSYGGLLREMQNCGPLVFALLFHDSGKGLAGEGHVSGSLRLARTAMARIQMPAQEQEAVLFLIEKHLELSGVMQSRDLFDPQTIREVAHRVETVERLKALTLLTYADISAVNPNVMTAWRAEQLWQLYLMVYNELTRELESERIEGDPTGSPERVEFLRGFPVRYLRTHTEAEIHGHIALEEKSRKRGVAVEIRKLDSAYQLTLVAGTDRPGLFAAAAGTLSSFGMNILKAEAFSNRRGLILDTFTFADPSRTLDLNPSETDRLRTTAERVIAGKLDVRQLLRNRPKPVLPTRSARIPAKVTFDGKASSSATLVEIVAEDRPGLLYDLASAISSHGCNIEVVLIDTQAHKAIDVFYITKDGGKIEPVKQGRLEEALQQACEPGA
jgi:[protein-PII] uridylyltransferase